MIYLVNIPIKAARRVWGSVISKEVSLPARVKNIRAITANVVCQDLDNVNNIQFGVFSLSLNNTEILLNSCLHCSQKAHNGGINTNTTTLEGSIQVKKGAHLRAVIEETLFSPMTENKDYTIKLYIHHD